MSVKLFWKDAYMKEFDSMVEKIDGNKVYLTETTFYPLGGGVLNDTGKILVNGREIKVLDVKKEGEEIAHHVDDANGIKVGEKVHGVIDWERRYALMRYHTAVHLIDGIFENKYKDGRITGGTVFFDRARENFGMDGLTREMVQGVLDEANKVAQEGHRVSARVITQAEALAMPNLARTEPGRKLIESLPEVRIVEIEGIDVQSDGGLHVANTKEIGKMTMGKFENKGRNSKEVNIILV